eukprot:CAMPEP_0113882254 /NCGR_PEP_ID=MMETSP0780_2-20120614/8845_1 /TAXON_ID=652834 /ORGANISM="Palpitomonas bilix" /LENGTH=977 /DNA_ID=CAMNT_0000869233 /DNA_START=47 /DNA_END=2980 /DNA_ORIENTATION=+ /assembly_acc=CAM_ASM_000599
MDDNNYDEFGNYIGPEIEDESSEDEMEEERVEEREEEQSREDDLKAGDGAMVVAGEAYDTAIVLHEDKKYYPSAEEVYGPEVETRVEDEDTQPLTQPIIAPVRVKNFDVIEKEVPETTFSATFLTSLMDCPQLVRNICFLGHLHHGKTTLMDMLVMQTHENIKPSEKGDSLRYTDTRLDEQRRGLSIKCTPMSLVLQNLAGKSFLYNIMDTPGHVNFVDEASAALRVSDGAVLVIDAVEGVLSSTEKLVKHAIEEKVPIVVVINKVDRLICELRLPPADAYFKLRHTIDELNKVKYSLGDETMRVSPEKGNVCFASGLFGFSFTLESFASMYGQDFPGLDVELFKNKLWGDHYYDAESRSFSRKSKGSRSVRAFVHFIMEPLYKLIGQAVGEEPKNLKATLDALGVFLTSSELHMNARPLLRTVMSRFFGPAHGLAHMISKFIPSPVEGNKVKLEHTYTGPLDDSTAKAVEACDRQGPLLINIVKLFHKPDARSFDAFGRVLSGTVHSGERVHVLGENYTVDDEEDMSVKDVAKIFVPEARYRFEINRAVAGNWVLLEGVDDSIGKTATIVAEKREEEAFICRPLRFCTIPVMKVAIEPLNPGELPKLLEGLRRISKSYPMAQTKVEESGEHVVLGTGELYMDCILHDLREMYGDVEVKVADPVVSFCETVMETSSLKCFAETPNRKNKITMIADPLEKGIAEDIETGAVSMEMPKKEVAKFFEQKYEWDILAARSVWAFGPDARGPNVLQDDTLASEVNKSLLNTVKSSVVQGFQWCVREGPLCEEPIRNVRFKVLHAELSDEPVFRGGGQIIPTARRVAYSSFLMATPRLMEPIYSVEIQAPADCADTIYTVLGRRRGHVVEEIPKPGTPFFILKGYVPVIDSYGFETDLRTHTQGQAMVLSMFDHWQVVPGDPLDKSVVLRPLEPASAAQLARDFMVKTRRRKGMSEDVSVSKFFDDPMLQQLALQQQEGANYY